MRISFKQQFLSLCTGTLLFFPVFMHAAETVALRNPLAFDSMQDFLVAILNVIMILAVPVIVFCIILAGFMYVTARGNPEKITVANQALLYAVIGGVIVMGAFAITAMVSVTVNEFTR